MPRRILLTNGLFLIVVGVVQAVFALTAHLFDMGPLRVWAGPGKAGAAIGLFEAFALAAVLGVLLVVAARRGGGRLWHAVAATIHSTLFGSNLVFWAAFVAADMTGPGIAATIAHALFALAEAACALGVIPGRRPP